MNAQEINLEESDGFKKIPQIGKATISVPIEQKIRLKQLCKKYDKNVSDVICMLIDLYYVDDQEHIRIVKSNIALAIQNGKATRLYIRQLKHLLDFLVVFLKRIDELHKR